MHRFKDTTAKQLIVYFLQHGSEKRIFQLQNFLIPLPSG